MKKMRKTWFLFFFFKNFDLMKWEEGDNLWKTQKKPSKAKFKHNLNKLKSDLPSSASKFKMSVCV